MKKINIDNLLRDNIKSLKPYSSARDEYSDNDAIFLDANENPNNGPFNRYPDPLQWKIKNKISKIKKVAPDKIFLGNGSDEAIDLLIRAFCEPAIDNIVSIDPTYGMYKVCADINHVTYKKVLLTSEFQLDTDNILKETNQNTKLIFLCSPNNPTSNSLNKEDITKILNEFNGFLILDEAYIDFSESKSLLPKLDEFQNLVILQTFSKAWGLAGIRLGMAFAHSDVIHNLNKIKYPYNINGLTLQKVDEYLYENNQKNNWINEILSERIRIAKELQILSIVEKVYPSDANFLLVRFKKARQLFDYLIAHKIVIRDRSRESLCDGCLRITIGTKNENNLLLQAITEYEKITEI